jgi:hypothetical protein
MAAFVAVGRRAGILKRFQRSVSQLLKISCISQTAASALAGVADVHRDVAQIRRCTM